MKHFADNLEDIIHGRARLAVMSFLDSVGEADFVKIRDEVNLSDGSLWQALKKLEDVGYVRLAAFSDGNRLRTNVILTKQGAEAFKAYAESLIAMLNAGSNSTAR